MTGGQTIEVGRVRVNGQTIAYRRAGSGPPLVLLHGFVGDSRLWGPQLAGLAGRFTVFAWDAPGTGASEDPAQDFGLADWANALTGFLGALDISRAHVCGLSWGGLLAQELYRHTPSVVGSLVLADSYCGWAGSLGQEKAAQRLARALADAELPPEKFRARYLPGMLSTAAAPELRAGLEELMAGAPISFVPMARAIAAADTRPLLATIRVPTLLIWGDADVRSPLPVGRAMHRLIPGSRLVVLPGAGHVSNLERPDAFNAAVRSFCDEIDLARA
jgi:pimeloyl-ACP methyl ester carboxylesterase